MPFIFRGNAIGHDFDTGDYAVCGSKRAGALVGEHVLRAVHEVLATGDVRTDPTPQEIMQLADKYRETAK